MLRWREEEIGPPLPESPFKNLSFDKEVMDFIAEVKRWYGSAEFFKSRGIPWKMSAALEGPPGTGKTSLARAIAQDLGIPIYMMDLTTMDNEELTKHWQTVLFNVPCMVLFEDLDRLFNDAGEFIPAKRERRPLTLDTLLQCTSGVEPAEGLLMLATANNPEKLDPALMRAGRLDRRLFLDILDKEGRQRIANRILEGWPDLIEKAVKKGAGDTGATFERRCARMAANKFWNKTQEDEQDGPVLQTLGP